MRRLVRLHVGGVLNRLHFISFANSGYTAPDRILSQAQQSQFFDSVNCYSESDIVPLLRRHPIHFLTNRKKGFGRFMWKPYVLLKRLSEVPNGDTVIYSDSGTHIDASGGPRLSFYLESMKSANKSIGVFETSSKYKAVSYVKRAVVDSYFPEFYLEPTRQMNSAYAGLVFARKTDRSEEIVGDWLRLCEQFLPWNDCGPSKNEIAEFVGQDVDNGILNLVLAKHNDYMLFNGKEVNLYDQHGFQLKHTLEDLEYSKLNWDSLRGYPFTFRRDR